MRHFAVYIFLLTCFSSCDDSQSNNMTDPSANQSAQEAVQLDELEFPSPFSIYKPLSYTEVGQRKAYSLKNKALQQELDQWIAEEQDASLEDDIYFALDITADNISFTTEKCSTNPNKVYEEGKTHCVGYSAFFNTVLAYLIKERGWKKRFKTKHLIGKIDILGADLHTVIDDPFFKDHDFNKIEDLESGAAVFVDPSLYDYSGTVWIQVRNK